MIPDVWAPLADTVAVRTAEGDIPLTRQQDDHWGAEVSLPSGTDYAIVIDDGPRSHACGP